LRGNGGRGGENRIRSISGKRKKKGEGSAGPAGDVRKKKKGRNIMIEKKKRKKEGGREHRPTTRSNRKEKELGHLLGRRNDVLAEGISAAGGKRRE